MRTAYNYFLLLLILIKLISIIMRR